MTKVPTSLLPDTIVVETYEGNSARGPVFGTPRRCRARVEGRRRRVTQAEGADVIGTATAMVRPDVVIAAEDRVTHGDKTYTVLEVGTGQGLRHPAYLEAILGGPR